MVKITIKNRNLKDLAELEVDATATVWEFKKLFYKKIGKYEPNR